VTPSDPFVETPTGVTTPMHINWQRFTDGRMPQFRDDVDWMAVYRHRPLLTMDEAAGFVSPNWREELRHPTLDDWWEPIRYQHRIGEIDVPVLHISGWYDDEEIGTPANFAAMVAAGRTGQRLLMGPWGHAVNTTRTLGEVDFGPDALIDLDACVTLSSMSTSRASARNRRPPRCGSSSWAPTNGATRRPGRPLARRRRCSTCPAAGRPTAGLVTAC
jgi:predicted acyl esterase